MLSNQCRRWRTCGRWCKCRPLGRRCQSSVLQWLEIGTWPEAPNWLVFFINNNGISMYNILELCLLVDNAFGITVDLCGPTSLRRSDLHLLRDSAINDRLAHVQLGEELQYTIFGDSAYPELSHLGSYQGRSRAYCSAMKKVHNTLHQLILFRKIAFFTGLVASFNILHYFLFDSIEMVSNLSVIR